MNDPKASIGIVCVARYERGSAGDSQCCPNEGSKRLKRQVETIVYLGLMATGAVVSLTRGFVIAGYLVKADFGLYALCVSVGVFLSSMVSFGLIEATWKTYPRLWSDGFANSVLSDARNRSRQLVVRALAASTLGGLAFALLQFNWQIGMQGWWQGQFRFPHFMPP
jgi:hypothetical protein